MSATTTQPAKRKDVTVVTAEVEGDHYLGFLFRLIAAYIFKVPEHELAFMATLPIPKSAAAMTVGGHGLPDSWYSTTLPGPTDTQWALYPPASALEKSWVYRPYPDAVIEGNWGWVKTKGAPSVSGWHLVVTMVMDPDTTLLRTVMQHRELLAAVALACRGTVRFQGAPGTLHMAWLSEFMAPGQ